MISFDADFAILLVLGVVLSIVVATPVAIALLLNRPRFTRAREILSNCKARWLAYLLPLSPAATLAVINLWPPVFLPVIPAIAGGLSVTVGSIVCASVAAVWLCIPADPERRIHIGYSVALALVLWLLGWIALVTVRLTVR